MSRPRVLVLCGGASDEHEVSLSSARSVLRALGESMEVTPLVIDRGGRLLSAEGSRGALEAGRAAAGEGMRELTALAIHNRPEASEDQGFDVVFPLLHGPNGEDGTVQGLLSLMKVPFVGSGVLGSAVGMDKLMMKTVFAANDLPQVEFRALHRSAWLDRREDQLAAIDLDYPIFVKPANLGSSVGIGKAKDRSQLEAAIDEAFRFDRRVIIEQGIEGARELEVAILGNDAPEASVVGEIRFDSEFYDYDSKYTEGRSQLVIPAVIPEDVAAECRRVALQAFSAIDAAGLARVDFFYDERSGNVLLNEINTMPGFTTTSMYPKLWEASGLPYRELVERLVALALERR